MDVLTRKEFVASWKRVLLNCMSWLDEDAMRSIEIDWKLRRCINLKKAI